MARVLRERQSSVHARAEYNKYKDVQKNWYQRREGCWWGLMDHRQVHGHSSPLPRMCPVTNYSEIFQG